MSVIRKKVGQIWRLNEYSYPLRADHSYVITELPEKDLYGYQEAMLRDVVDGETYTVERRSMTTSRNKWTYMGNESDGVKPYVYSCRQCGAKQIEELHVPVRRVNCGVCGSNRARIISAYSPY